MKTKLPSCISVNGRKFARTSADFVASLFDTEGKPATCTGFYKARKWGVLLLDAKQQPFAFIVGNKHKEYFIVTAFQTAEGIRYMHSTTAHTRAVLGLDDLTDRMERELATRVIANVRGVL
jgi:hypothetical protein